jgi:hypothetical protein
VRCAAETEDDVRLRVDLGMLAKTASQGYDPRVVEDRVGRLSVSSRAPDAPQDYRTRSMPVMELTRGSKSLSRHPRTAIALVALLGVGLLVFAILVHDGPAIGAVSVGLAAMLWLVVGSSRRWTEERIRVELDDDALHVTGKEKLRIPIADIQEVGIGVDTPPLHTLFVHARNAGRMLLLDGLTREEADLAERWLREIVAR